MQELAPGDQLGAYHVLSIIGRGGMGVVYLAEHASLERVRSGLIAPSGSISEFGWSSVNLRTVDKTDNPA